MRNVQLEFWSYRFGSVNLFKFLGHLVDDWARSWKLKTKAGAGSYVLEPQGG